MTDIETEKIFLININKYVQIHADSINLFIGNFSHDNTRRQIKTAPSRSYMKLLL
jgi:hypothetical protein